THHFAPRVAEYVGLDYSPAMIAACQTRFSHLLEGCRFVVGDVRDLSNFADDSFDLILFSFNGLDYIGHDERLLALQEIHRVGKPGGYFVFSSHNLQGIEPLFCWRDRLNWNPIHNYIETMMWAFLRGFNWSITLEDLARSDYAIIKDEPHNFKLANYYIRPHAQLNQLAPYFEQVRVYSWQTGLEIKDEIELQKNRDLWLYYLCQIRS
ncbi:MAG: class I SAM-dependent methyltransferase, partial [Spirulina sp. SIO3F2]|nr:class I SAM-dependent methyltransferase [Spirulina sp. SIO3F2]